MKKITLLALFIIYGIGITFSVNAQNIARDRLKYPLAMDLKGETFNMPGPINTQDNPLAFFNINISQNSSTSE